MVSFAMSEKGSTFAPVFASKKHNNNVNKQ